jgi:hypothetical protein
VLVGIADGRVITGWSTGQPIRGWALRPALSTGLARPIFRRNALAGLAAPFAVVR